MMDFYRGDLSLFGQQFACGASKRRVDLQALYKRRRSDEFHLGHFGLQSIPSILIEKNLGVQLLSELSLVPLLLNESAKNENNNKIKDIKGGNTKK
jgi:hypothetical protein